MPDPIFYVGSERDRQHTGFVPAKFLSRNGGYVMDPMPGGSQKAYLYSDSSGNKKTEGSVANPNNYLIVPAGYTEQQAKEFATHIANTAGQTYPGDETGASGFQQALAQMVAVFSQGGSQDLQRHPNWGIPQGSVVPAFVGSASNHLGYVTGLAGLPMSSSEIGGGAINGANAVWQAVRPWIPLAHLKSTPIDTGGDYFLSRQNHANISQGYSDGLAASKSPSPFESYGNVTQAQPDDGQIGGDGIPGWRSSLSGVDPDQPEPTAWPPLADQPIRYLGRRTQ
jgi:hypothetical protein